MMHQQQNTNPPAGGTGALRRLPRHQIQRRHSSFSDTTDKYFAASDESVSLTWSSKVKKSSKNNVPIEYWLSSAGLWINTAQLSLGKSKLFIEIPSEDPNRRRKVKFVVDSSLRIEYNVPIATDFHLVLSGGGALIRHRVAFFSEDEANTTVYLLKQKGVQVIAKRNGAVRKKNILRPISEGFEQPAIPSAEAATLQQDQFRGRKSNMAILRRKSTGSFDENNGQGVVAPSRQLRQLKHSVSTFSTTMLQRRNSMLKATTSHPSRAKWYEDVDYYDDEEIEKYNRQIMSNKNSRNSLETEDEDSDIETSQDFNDSGKLFTSATPTFVRPRAPTNEKLEKYKFMLINIEPDAEIVDPGTFALMQDSYLGFDFNDYPAEVLCPFPQKTPPSEAEGSSSLTFERQQHLTERKSLVMEAPPPVAAAVPKWIRRSYEQLHQHSSSSARVTCKINPYISQSTGNLASSNVSKCETQENSYTCDHKIMLPPNTDKHETTTPRTKKKELNNDIQQLLSTSRGSPTALSSL